MRVWIQKRVPKVIKITYRERDAWYTVHRACIGKKYAVWEEVAQKKRPRNKTTIQFNDDDDGG